LTEPDAELLAELDCAAVDATDLDEPPPLPLFAEPPLPELVLQFCLGILIVLRKKLWFADIIDTLD
jgi:hypothetical protein